jgi:hypothetical protein
VCCASAGAERRGGVLCADPAYVVIPQAKKKKKTKKYSETKNNDLKFSSPAALDPDRRLV